MSVAGVDAGELEKELRDRGKEKLEGVGRLREFKSVIEPSRRSGSRLSMIGRKAGAMAEAGWSERCSE